MFLTWILDAKFRFVVAVVVAITTIILHHVFRSEKAAAMISHETRRVEQLSRQSCSLLFKNNSSINKGQNSKSITDIIAQVGLIELSGLTMTFTL